MKKKIPWIKTRYAKPYKRRLAVARMRAETVRAQALMQISLIRAQASIPAGVRNAECLRVRLQAAENIRRIFEEVLQ